MRLGIDRFEKKRLKQLKKGVCDWKNLEDDLLHFKTGESMRFKFDDLMLENEKKFDLIDFKRYHFFNSQSLFTQKSLIEHRFYK
jgi:hypothetical protein